MEKVFQDFRKSAPQLHTLRIGPGYYSYSFRSVGSKFPIHEDFLCDTERLRRVELTNCNISWDSRLLTGLTRVNLDNCSKSNSSIIQVLHALQRMPALTDLYLIDSIPDGSGGPSSYPVVDLPCLRTLYISSCVNPMTALLRHITFPHSAILNLTCKETHSAQVEFSNLLSFLATKYLSSLVMRTLSLRVDNILPYDLELTTPIIHDYCSSSQVSPFQLQLVLAWSSELSLAPLP